ncbi:SNF2 helicase associated domain-containing protein [Senegalia sp. (in: firmicutes)]|uniref:SNF2 helicase associated domain-containing protein n=1 Tax=Senegalia sp. (in: firmicutes) TaxID=1924098 RepID=UPI003F96D3C3
MFNITEDLIRNSVLNDRTFKKSIDYYKDNYVKNLLFYRNKDTFSSIVEGTKNYQVNVSFDEFGNLDHADCDCPAYREYWGYCKHIGATLFKIMDQDSRSRFDKKIMNQSDENITNLLNYYRYNQTDSKIPINIEYNYEFDPNRITGLKYASSLNLRIGEEKLYVVKSIKTLFQNIEYGNSIVFGKNFTFEPDIHTFKEEDKAVIDMLKEMYDNENYINEYSSYGSGSMFKGKNVTLTPNTLKRFFTLMKNRKINAKIYDFSYEDIEIKDGEILVDFSLKDINENLSLKMNHEGLLVPLVSNGEYFFSNESILNIPEKQRTSLIPILNTMNSSDDETINIPKEYRESFISEVYPSVKKVGPIKIDEKVKSSIYNPDLIKEIYLDNENENIIANIKLIYGDTTIEPFSKNKRNLENDDKILLRDIEAENEVLSIFERANFKVNKENNIYLEDEDDIYTFLYEKLPSLQEKADIYYSNSFKNIKLKDPSSFKGGIRLNEKSDMLEFSFEIDGVSNEELKEIFNSLNKNKKYHRLKDGSFLPLQMDSLNNMGKVIDNLELDLDDFHDSVIEIPKFNALYLDDELKDESLHFINRNLAFKELVQNIKEPKDMEFMPPTHLKDVLRNYQNIGFKWLKTLSLYGLGGILADDMGLGKTIQVLSFLTSEKKEKEHKPSIIIVPTSLVYNWEDEIKKFAEDLKYLIISGDKKIRSEKIKDANDYDVVITSYPLIRRDIELYNDFYFKYCILDEAQHIKNPTSLNSKSVKMIKSETNFALTGTPIENTLTELWSIFDFILPGYLFSHNKFIKKYEKPIIKENDIKALESLKKHITPFILRRLKKDVLKELPDKIEHKITAELTNDQKKIYLSYLNEIKGDLKSSIEEKGFNKSHMKMLAGLTRLRQICCHPNTFIENYTGDSGKLKLLEEILNETLASGHRILLFSQFTSMLSIIRKMLESKDIKYKYLDGSTKSETRGELVKEFNDGDGDIFLISLRAGGTGLNLTGADTVIHFDPWWNPAVENQATDRAHRIGQKNTVHVMNLITKGTIEEKIFELQEKKKGIVDSVIKPGEKMVSKMTEEELRDIFGI